MRVTNGCAWKSPDCLQMFINHILHDTSARVLQIPDLQITAVYRGARLQLNHFKILWKNQMYNVDFYFKKNVFNKFIN